MNKINNIDEFKKALNSKKAVLYFTASWCPDCFILKPQLPFIEASNDDFKFYEINRDDFLDECEALDILGIPSFLIFNDGVEVIRFVSKMRKNKEEVEDFLEKGRAILNV